MHASVARPVVVAYDGSPESKAALRETAHLLGHRTVIVATVWEPGLADLAVAGAAPVPGMMSSMADPAMSVELDRAMRDHAERVAGEGAQYARSLGLAAEPHAVPDEVNVPETIAEIADELDAQVVVVGSRGISGMRSRLLGSTSHGVLSHCRRPVLVVRAEVR
jgi:nucleotide-binding universal stress UspA family protein